VDLAQNGIRPQRWELEALARGATVNYDGKKFAYPVADGWSGFTTVID
ncbi:putative phage replication initiation protein, partial [Salmonella enterica subsp. enterica serovar Braenderup str. ATCC BAA-664]